MATDPLAGLDLSALTAGLTAGPEVPPAIKAIMKKAAKKRTPKEKNQLRAWQRQNQRPTYRQPGMQLPPFLMDLLGGGMEYEPQSDASLMQQAAQMASAQGAPGIAQIQSMLSGGTRAINELTAQVGARMAPIAGQVRGLYEAAGTQTGAVNQAMADRLAQMGVADQAGLNEAFQAAGLQAAAPVSQGIADTAAAASQASFATGSSSLQRLAAEGAAAGAHAAALPGIASLGGQAAIAALAREAQAATAGIAAQQGGLQQEAYRSLRSSEDARADAAAQRRSELAGALMDWNQNIQNNELQVYLANLGFFGDEQRAQEAMRRFGVETGLNVAELGINAAHDAAVLAQNQSQFETREANDRAAAAAANADETADERAADIRRRQAARKSYIDPWRTRALSLGEKLGEGFMAKVPDPNDPQYGTPTSERRYYTTREARNRLTRLLSDPLLHSPEARRFGLKQRLINRLVNQAMQAGWASGQFRRLPPNTTDVPGPGA